MSIPPPAHPDAHSPPAGHRTPRASAAPPTLAEVARRVLSTYRDRFAAVTVAAICVFGPLTALDVLVDHWAEERLHTPGGATGAAIVLIIVGSTSALVFGSAFYAGLLDHIVGEHQHGHERRTIGTVLLSLPYRRLIVADLLLSAIVVAGLALLVLPGLIAFTLFCLVGPLINIERLPVLDAFRRSAQLVRGHARLAFVVVTLPVIAEQAAHHAVEEAIAGDGTLLGAFVISGLFAATAGALVGLAEVTLAYLLVLHDRIAQRPVSPPQPSS